jgi:hypothetical protein
LRRARLPALACAAALLGAACGRGPARADETLSLAWTLAPDPPAVGPSRLSLRLADERGRPLGGARLQVEAGMTHPGMPPVVASAAEEEAGRYRADLDFTMAGSWFILVTGEIPHRGAFSRRIDVPHVRGR